MTMNSFEVWWAYGRIQHDIAKTQGNYQVSLTFWNIAKTKNDAFQICLPDKWYQYDAMATLNLSQKV